ncbi:MAG: pitrilysin family protein [Planctomycetia bacterium]|nr:pitrilysin family protein [Planctomycetia bacterium]
MEFRSHRLANGLEIVAECNPDARTTAVGFFVKTGARDETAEVAGVSHFLEHMVFKGTARRSAADVNREFDELGAHYNAFTSKEHTAYYAAMLPELTERQVDLLADIMRPALRTADFGTEKQVILEAIKMYEDQPPFGADEKCEAAHYGQHPLAQSVLGTIESVGALPVEAMREYFERRYSPGNLALAAAGKVDFGELVRIADERCGAWTPANAERVLLPAGPHAEFRVLHKESSTLEYVLQLSMAPGAMDDDRYAAKILATVLGDDTGSRLYWALVDTGLAESAGVGHYDYQETGLFGTSFNCEADNTASNLQMVRDIFRRAEQDGIAPAEMFQAKNKINSRVVLGSERPRVRLFTVGGNWIQRREYRSVRDDLDAVERVTIADLEEVLRKYPLSVNTTFAVGPLTTLDPPA